MSQQKTSVEARDQTVLAALRASMYLGRKKGRGARHKGIGFKSVFLASQRPVVLSNGWSFCFDLAEGPLSSEKNAVEMPLRSSLV